MTTTGRAEAKIQEAQTKTPDAPNMADYAQYRDHLPWFYHRCSEEGKKHCPAPGTDPFCPLSEHPVDDGNWEKRKDSRRKKKRKEKPARKQSTAMEESGTGKRKTRQGSLRQV